MAIVIEEGTKKNSLTIINVLLWVLFLAGLGAFGYYIFFKQPELVEVAAPASFSSTEQISKLELHPEEIISNSQFKSLKSYVTIPAPSNIGRSNPFSQF